MKKFFVSLALVAFCAFANAQTIIPVHKGEGLLRKSNEKIVLNNNAKFATPKKAASLDNTTLWGYYMGDLSDEIYCGGTGTTSTTYYVGYYVPGDGILKGCSINGVNIPIYTTTYMQNVKIWISEDLETNLVTQSVKVEELKQMDFNAIALDEPFKIPETGVYVGVQFSITNVVYQGDAYPILFEVVDAPAPQSMVLKLNVAGRVYDWEDYTYDWGQYAMQLFCSDLTMPERYAYFKSASSISTRPNDEVSLPVVIGSDCSEKVSSIDYTVEINGNKTSKHLDLSTPIASGFSKSGKATISFTAPETYGAYTANISIEKVNGKDNDASDKVLSAINKVVTKIVNRRTVVEEFTGTGCGWCPRGWLGMEMLKETKDNFIGIAFHKYNSDDPMYVANYYPTTSLGISGAPGCSVDRKLLGTDPYYGNDYGTGSIANEFDYYNSMLPDVDVTVSGKFNDDFTAVDITADIEYLTDGDKYTVAYVLTADSLSGTSTAWRQSNSYASYSATSTQIPHDENINKFCKGGIYGSSSVPLVFNDVMIGSSYNNSGVNQASALTGEVKAGETITNSYTVDMPTKATLKNAIDNNEVYAVVLVIASDGTIANAAKAKVTGAETSIGQAIVDADAREVARYNAAGQVISAPQKGLNIIKLSNGKTKKVIVK